VPGDTALDRFVAALNDDPSADEDLVSLLRGRESVSRWPTAEELDLQPPRGPGLLGALGKGFGEELTLGYGLPARLAQNVPEPQTISERAAYAAGALAGSLPAFAAAEATVGAAAAGLAREALLFKRLYNALNKVGKVHEITREAKVGDKVARFIVGETRAASALNHAVRDIPAFAAVGGLHALPDTPETSDDAIQQRAMSALKGALTGGVFGAAGGAATGLGRAARAGLMGGVGAALSVAEGGSVEDALIQGGLFSVLSAVMPTDRAYKTLREVAKSIDDLPDSVKPDATLRVVSSIVPDFYAESAETLRSVQRPMEAGADLAVLQEGRYETPPGPSDTTPGTPAQIQERISVPLETPRFLRGMGDALYAKYIQRAHEVLPEAPPVVEERPASVEPRGMGLTLQGESVGPLFSEEGVRVFRPLAELDTEGLRQEARAKVASIGARGTPPKVETIEEYLARGGKVQQAPPLTERDIEAARALERFEERTGLPVTSFEDELLRVKRLSVEELKDALTGRVREAPKPQKRAEHPIVDTIVSSELGGREISVDVVSDPGFVSEGGRLIRGAYHPETDTITLNVADLDLSSTKGQRELRRVLREELAHRVLVSDEGEAAIRRYAKTAMTAEDIKALAAAGYTRLPKESAADYRLRLADEFVAKAAGERGGAYNRIVDGVRKFLATKGLVRLTKAEAARALVRSLEKKTPTLLPKRPGKVARYSLRPTTTLDAFSRQRSDTDDLAKSVLNSKDPVSVMYKRADIALTWGHSLQRKLRLLAEGAGRAFVDVNWVPEQALRSHGKSGELALMKLDLARGSSARVAMAVDDLDKAVYNGLTDAERAVLDRVIQSTRIIEISKYKPDVVHPEGLTGNDHAAYLASIPAPLMAKLEPRVREYRRLMRKHTLDPLFRSGCIDETQYMALASRFYEPRKFLEYIDPDETVVYDSSGHKVSVGSSGIRKLGPGSTSYLENDSRLLFMEAAARADARAARNEANIELYRIAMSRPENEVVRVLRGNEEPPSGWESLFVMVDGVKKRLAVPRDFARGWLLYDPILNHMTARVLGYVSGTKFLKAMATGYNPAFALSNIPRDLVHIWLTTQEYSPALPKYLFQIASDIKAVIGDAWNKTGSYREYIQQGGGMELLSLQGREFKSLEGIGKVLGKLNEFSEIVTRLALRRRAILNGKSPLEATYVARSYMDFATGGSVVKAVDTVVPYLNAGIVATRGLFRAARTDPKLFTWKVAQVMGTAATLYLINSLYYPDVMKEIPDREKVNNFIIATPFKYVDRDGETRSVYFKIAKDQSQRVFTSAIEALLTRVCEGRLPSNQLIQAISDFLPADADSFLPPTLSAWLTYTKNKDFWLNEDVWKGPDVITREEYYASTHPFWVSVGKLTGLSPVRTQRALQKMLTYGNVYSDLAGWGAKRLLALGDDGSIERDIVDDLVTNATTRRLVALTPKYSEDTRRYLKGVAEEENTLRWRLRRGLAEATRGAESVEEYRRLAAEYINTIESPRTRKYLRQKARQEEALFGVPQRRLWESLASLPPEGRARAFYEELYSGASEDDKAALMETAARIPGFMSREFKKSLRKILEEEGYETR